MNQLVDMQDRFDTEVYGQDQNLTDSPHGGIQWKGTNVCIDLYCSCGHRGHVDGDFFYMYRCPKCNTLFAVGQTVKLIPLNKEQEAYVMGGGTCPPMTDADLELDDVDQEPDQPPVPRITVVEMDEANAQSQESSEKKFLEALKKAFGEEEKP